MRKDSVMQKQTMRSTDIDSVLRSSFMLYVFAR